MPILTVLVNREDFCKVEEELQHEFVYNVLSSCGIPQEELNEIFPLESFSLKHKIALRKRMAIENISIIDDRDGGIKIFFDETLIAEWKKAFFSLKENKKALYKKDKLFLEMKAEYWTIFDEDQD